MWAARVLWPSSSKTRYCDRTCMLLSTEEECLLFLQSCSIFFYTWRHHCSLRIILMCESQRSSLYQHLIQEFVLFKRAIVKLLHCQKRLYFWRNLALHLKESTTLLIALKTQAIFYWNKKYKLLLLRQLLLVVFTFLLLFACIILPLQLELCNFHMQFIASDFCFIQKPQSKLNWFSLFEDKTQHKP